MNLELLNRAEGYCQLALFEEAWETTEQLPAYEKASPEVAGLRLRIVIALAKWEVGEEVADLLSEGYAIENKQTAARYFLARARSVHGEGDPAEARRLFEKAENAWKGIDRDFSDEDRERWC